MAKLENKYFDKQITIVYPATVDWYLLYQRPQQLLTRLAKYDNVRCIFITSEAYKKLPRPIIKIHEDMYVVSSSMNYSHLIKGKKVLLYSYPFHYNSARHFDFSIFDALDNPVDEFASWRPSVDNAVKAADIISCTAKVMYDEHKLSGKPTFMLPNGADFDHFKKAHHQLPRPSDFPKGLENEVVVGFYGALASWVDWDIIKEISKEFHVVLVGANQYYSPPIKGERIHILPHKDYSYLPYYLSQFDVTIVPFKLTQMIEGCDPIKFYEYLAAGKPVVATHMSELMKFSDVAYFADIYDVNEKIQQAFLEDDLDKQVKRMEVAKANSWDARVETMLKHIGENLP